MNNKICSVCGAEVGVYAKGMCKRCYNKQYREDNKEHIAARKKQYNEDSKEHRKQYNEDNKEHAKQYREDNKEHIAAYKKQYDEDNKEHAKQYREDNKEHIKQYYEDNKERITARQRQYREDNKEHIAARNKQYNEDSKEHIKQYYEDNKERIASRDKQYYEDNREAKGITTFGTEAHRIKLSCAKQGIDIKNWDGFAVEAKYCPKFNEACREKNREKYGRRCFICNKTEAENGKRLSVHHVDMNKFQGCDGHVWQLVPVCMKHHKHDETTRARIQYLLEHVW